MKRLVVRYLRIQIAVLFIIFCWSSSVLAVEADLIIRNGKIVTVDSESTICRAMAVKGNRILRIGTNKEILQLKGGETKVVNLNGKMVLPGFIDSHVHPCGACMTEFDHPIPQMDSIEDVLNYIKMRANALADGEWIVVQQVFITRLREQRYPTREELDKAAPRNPTVFRTGPDASLNSQAMKLSGIDRNFRVTDGGPGHIEKDSRTGEPTGILRSCNRYIKSSSSGAQPAERDRYQRLLELFKSYNTVGITSICDGSSNASNLKRYQKMLSNGELTVRVSAQHYVDTIGPIEQVKESIRKVAQHPLCKGSPKLRIIGIKVFLDGGMLTGSAYMRKPWGVSKIYAIDDPEYRGVLFIPKERLLPMVRTATEHKLQFTAHTVGDGAVHTLLDVYEQLNKTTQIRELRPCITHSNFMSAEAVKKAASLGVIPLIQPAWLYLDTRTLDKHFGYDRLRYFQPLRSLFEADCIAAGGSDHMQKIGSVRSINPYDPFLGIWTTVTRRAKWYQGRLHPEEALSREQAIRFYTINCAKALFQEKYVGSLEKGKLADFVVLDTDLLTCPTDDIRSAKVVSTYMDGRLVFER